MIPAYVYGFETVDYHTEALNTAIVEAIQAQDGHRLCLIDFEYLNDTTAHLASFMYAKDPVATPGSCRNLTSAIAAAGQKVLNVVTAPTDPAGNAVANLDVIAYQLPTGVWEFNIIASVVASAITLTTNIAVAVAAAAKVMIFGAVADGANSKISLPVSVVTRKGEGHIAMVHPYVGEPYYLSIDNVTAAGWLMNAVFAHINK